MGFRFNKSISLGKFFRLNVSRAGIGGSIGVGPFRVGVGPRGTRLTADLPGAGTSYVKQWGWGADAQSGAEKKGGVEKKGGRKIKEASEPQTPSAMPAPGFFAPAHEKDFARAVSAYRAGQTEEALAGFLDASAEEPGAALSAAVILSQRAATKPQAIALLENLVQQDVEFPTPLMQKYLGEARLPIRITPSVEASVPADALAATLLLVELYQEQGRADEAAGLLEELEALAGEPALTLSLCELYAERGLWDGVIERAKDVAPVDDVTLETRIYYGRAMQAQGLDDAAISVFTDALKRKKNRNPRLLREAAYWRAVSCQKLGKASQASREFQKLYAEDPDFRDVAGRVAKA